MAFCNKCGSELKEGAKFCARCGAPTANPAAAPGQAVPEGSGYQQEDPKTTEIEETVISQETSETPVPAVAPWETLQSYEDQPQASSDEAAAGENAVIRTLKQFGGSPLLLAYALIAVIGAVLSLFSAPGLARIGILIGLVPVILTVIGLIIAFADCRNNGIPQGKGIGVYKAGKIVEIVFIAIIFGLALLLLILLMIMGGTLFSGGNSVLNEALESVFGSSVYGFEGIGDLTGPLMAVFIVLIAIIAVIMILGILIDTSLIKAAKTVKRSLDQGRVAGSVPLYPAVMMIIGAVFACIGLISFLISGGLAGSVMSAAGLSISDLSGTGLIGATALTGISLAIGLAKLILGAVLVIRLRGKLAALR